MSLTALREQLAAVIAPPPLPGGGIPTGIAALDAVLSDGGLPLGRLTEIVGGRGSGKTTLVREVVAQALADKRWVAYIDAGRTLAPADWAALATTERLWIVRPPPGAHGPWCADVLLRSGAFGLVVLDGGSGLPRGVAVRLTRLARESNAAFVVLRDEGDDDGQGERPPRDGRRRSPDAGVMGGVVGGVVGGAVRLRVRRREGEARPTPPGHEERSRERTDPPRPSNGRGEDARETDAQRWESLGRRLAGAREDETPAKRRGSLRTPLVLQVTVEKGGTHHMVEVGCAIEVARRMCAHSQVPDRRGVATRNRRGERAAPDAPGVRRTAPPPDGGGGCGDAPTHSANVASGASGATLAHKRRCAEPAIARDEFLLGPRYGVGSGKRDTPIPPRPLPAPPPDARRKPQRPEPRHRA